MAFKKIYSDDTVELGVRWSNGQWQLETIWKRNSKSVVMELPELALDELSALWPSVKYTVERG